MADAVKRRPLPRSRLYRFATAIARHSRKVLVAWALLALASLLLVPQLLSSVSLPSVGIPGSSAQQAAETMAREFPLLGREQMLVVFHSDRLIATDPAYVAAISAASLAMKDSPGITSISWLPRAAEATPGKSPQRVGILTFRSLPYRDPHAAYVFVAARGEDQELISRYPALRAAVEEAVDRASSGQVNAYLVGRTPIAYDLRQAEIADARVSEGIAVALALVVLWIGMRRLRNVAVTLTAGGAAIVVTLGLFALISPVVGFDAYLLTVVTVSGLAIGTDYSLLIVSRYREELLKGVLAEQAVGRAVATAGKTVAIAAAVALCGLMSFGIQRAPLLRDFGIGVAVALAVALLAALTLTPALLVTWLRTLEPGAAPGRGVDPSDEGLAARWARHLMRRPWPYLLGCVVVLLACTGPLLSLQTGNEVLRQVPSDTSSGRGMAILERDSFAGAPGAINIVIRRPAGAPAPDLAAMLSGLDTDPRVTAVGLGRMNDLSVAVVIPRQAADSPGTIELVRRIRTDMATSASAGQQVLVGGVPAVLVDDYHELVATSKWLIAYVLVLTFLFLVIVFRSILVPLKAVITNALAVAGALGALVAVFQWGFGASLLGVRSTGTILIYIPIMVFVTVYGLSLDYEIFLVRRIRETYRVSTDDRQAISVGLQRSARPILLAAAVMLVVFAGLLTSRSLEVKQFGFALVAALVIDATLIRLVLVPVTMKVFGRWNWWLPGRRKQ